ncbi:MAG TPA: hypothetical protein VHU83_19620 [Bryobacteraceae bacterium]|jgi:hypothetical protein|nr:hypothetical protein [Bryobacteraceae bacterium]
MPPQEEHEKIENLVELPHQAERSARSLEDAVDSHATLDGYYAMNNVKPPEELEREAREDQPADRGGHPLP